MTHAAARLSPFAATDDNALVAKLAAANIVTSSRDGNVRGDVPLL